MSVCRSSKRYPDYTKSRTPPRRDFGAVHFFEMALNFAHRHAAGIQRQNLVVKAGPAGLMFGNELRLETAVAIPWDLDGQGTEIALERLGTATAARVTAVVGNGLMLVVFLGSLLLFYLLIGRRHIGCRATGGGV